MTGCFQANRPRPDHRGGSASPTEVRARFVPDVPDGFVPLAEAAKRLGVARQTVLHQVQRGERRALEVTKADEKAFGSRFPTKSLDCLPKRDGEEAV